MQFDRLKRRDFITVLGGAAAGPVAARAEQRTMPVIGFINLVSPEMFAGRLQGFHRGLEDAGYVEGENVAIVYRWADNQINSAREPSRARARNTRPRTPDLLRGLIFGGSKAKLLCSTELFTLRKWSGYEKENETS
jgi:hypothetical protein